MRLVILSLLLIAALLSVGALLEALRAVSQVAVEPQPSVHVERSIPTHDGSPPPPASHYGASPPPPPPPAAGASRPCAAALDAGIVGAAAAGNTARVVFATFANHAQLDFALNWIAHLAALELAASALVGATDDETARGLERAGTAARCFQLTSDIGSAEAKWGSPGFSQMGRTKSKLLRTLLTLNATVLFADADVAFLRDPLPYVSHQLAAGAHVLFHTDGFGASPAAWRDADALEQPAFGWGPELNTGLFVATPAARRLAESWCEVLKSDAAFANWKNDQQTLNELLRRGVRVPPTLSSAAAHTRVRRRAHARPAARAPLPVGPRLLSAAPAAHCPRATVRRPPHLPKLRPVGQAPQNARGTAVGRRRSELLRPSRWAALVHARLTK
jgi:hypothetical protein